jgi:glycosyltransferase involved in cell wall biosynthesis
VDSELIKNANKLLPVAIMAHNEEKVIEKSIESIFHQESPAGYSVKVIVVANGCVDRTEEIVREFEKKNPDKVKLISMKEKGKTKAINQAISFFEDVTDTSSTMPYIIFLDADCEFIGKEVFLDFVKRFEETPELCAVGADCLPDVFFNQRKDIVAKIYRAVYSFGKSLKMNSLSGMCYAIRYDILRKIDFPDFQFAEDMFVSSRLSGRFLKDKNMQILFKTPSNLQDEIERRTRQAISTQRYHEYYAYLKGRGVKVKLFEQSIGNDYIWSGNTNGEILKSWLRISGLQSKLLIIAYIFIKKWANLKAYSKMRKLKINAKEDYWKVSR